MRVSHLQRAVAQRNRPRLAPNAPIPESAEEVRRKRLERLSGTLPPTTPLVGTTSLPMLITAGALRGGLRRASRQCIACAVGHHGGR
jgi:hypothetical protein